MTEENIEVPEEEIEEEEEEDRKKRLILLILLLIILLGLCGLFSRYLVSPEPLPDMILPEDNALNFPPHYLFSIYNVDKPFGVTLSPDEELIYVTESGGDRIGHIFDRQGNEVGQFSPPNTNIGDRSMVYLDTDASGNLFVVDRLQKAIHVFSPEGEYMDTILDPTVTLSEYVSQHIGGLDADTFFSYTIFQPEVQYQIDGGALQVIPGPGAPSWEPLSVYFSSNGEQIHIADLVEGEHKILSYDFPQDWLPGSGNRIDLAPVYQVGTSGDGNGELLFPNKAAVDSQGRLFVTDGNNGRIAVWDEDQNFLFAFGRGTGEGALSLPRGMIIDERDRLFVVDAVGQNVKVYDVSGEEPQFLYAFGGLGNDDGMFTFPNDIAIDSGGRIYIVDRENNRVQVWSY